MSAVDEYLAQFEDEQRTRLMEMRAIVRAAAPRARETGSSRMPTLQLKDRDLVQYAAFGQHLAFYPGRETLAAFEDDLAGWKHSGSSVQFPLDQPLPAELVTAMTRHAEALLRAALTG
ncbi:ribonuclease Z [Raineyella antarctica]|uniref:Ribonuclease Z n=1 Tax=Raineyella antarctica TaxID=1577474 RepID=A0A1G6GH41_9ACTN|nr:DUF1801 domain-containing protein [Raineyella antarctica]SDB81143.1 ribonuclease Z [Raineyella antarctica]